MFVNMFLYVLVNLSRAAVRTIPKALIIFLLFQVCGFPLAPGLLSLYNKVNVNTVIICEVFMKQTTYAIDNSAILYLALMRRRHTNIYRFTMTMREEVDPDILQQAMERIYRRFPTIIAGFRRELLRYRVVPVDAAPLVLPDPGVLIPMNRKEIESCAYRIFYRGRDISYEGFHAAADGYGAVASFTTLISEYLRLRHGSEIPVCSTLRHVDDAPMEHELEDSYLTHQEGKPLHLPSRYAYQLPGVYDEPRVYPCSRFYHTDAVLAAARKHGVSMTSLLSSIMASAIMDIQTRHTQKLKPVRIMVPVDLRKLFGSSTLRNFILYTLPTMEPGDEHLPLRELAHRFHTQIREQLDPKRMAAIMAYNVRAQANFFFRAIPVGIQCALMRLAYRFFGESNSSITLTNLGNIQLPQEMASQLEAIQCIPTPRAGSPYNCSVISLNGRLTITFSRFCRRPELEAVFFAKLDEVLAAV